MGILVIRNIRPQASEWPVVNIGSPSVGSSGRTQGHLHPSVRSGRSSYCIAGVQERRIRKDGNEMALAFIETYNSILHRHTRNIAVPTASAVAEG